jgi:hypothetical protein
MNEKTFTILGNALWILLVIAMIVWMAGCAPTIETRYITTELHHDIRPILPKVSATELQCLTKETVQKLYDRQRLITDYAIVLESIIDSTKK